MNKLFLIVIFLTAFVLSATAQSYLGYVTTTVNLRSEPNTNCQILASLQKGSALFVISKEKINEFYHVIDIGTNKEGYVHSNYVQLDKALPKNEQGVFIPKKRTSKYMSVVNIHNNTNETLTLRLNDELYTFSPHEWKSLTLSPGSYSYRASVPGVIPNYGTETIQSNYEYEWIFYISTIFR